MAKYYCILFDADNTLLNFDAAESKALEERLVKSGIAPDEDTEKTDRRSAAKSCSTSGSAASSKPLTPPEAAQR